MSSGIAEASDAEIGSRPDRDEPHLNFIAKLLIRNSRNNDRLGREFLRPSLLHRKEPPRISPSQILLTAHVLSTHLSFTFPSQPSQCFFPPLPGFLSFHPKFRNRPLCAQPFA
jgi:hypothetical protein